MPPPLRIGTKIHSLEVHCLKNINNLQRISFEGHPITGIFGPNCCGKSTVLHALASCYQPPAGSEQYNYKFCHFFLPNTDALWDGSKLTVSSTYSYQGAEYSKKEIEYYKTTSRWTPRYDIRHAGDDAKIRKVFELLNEFIKTVHCEYKSDFQMIVMEHVPSSYWDGLDHVCLVEEFTGDNALIRPCDICDGDDIEVK